MPYNFEDMINIVNKSKIESKEIIDYCQQKNISLIDFIDQFSIQLAHKYLQGELDYTFCDHAMNNVFGFMTTKEFNQSNIIDDDGPAFRIFLAFDRGEYYHSEDDRSIDPVEKYTKPSLLEILNNLDS